MNKFGSGMPQMGAAFAGWQSQLTMTRRTDVVEDGIVTTKDINFTFMGTVQPLSPKAIALKPEGQRAWTWLQIHCFASAPMDVNDVITFRGGTYKVMAKIDYSLNNYIEYHLVKDYQG